MAVKIQIFFADLLLKNALHLKLTKIIRYHSYHEKHHFRCKKNSFFALNKFSFQFI